MQTGAQNILHKKYIENISHARNFHTVAKFIHIDHGSVLPDDPVIDEIQMFPAADHLLPDFSFHPLPVIRSRSETETLSVNCLIISSMISPLSHSIITIQMQ